LTYLGLWDNPLTQSPPEIIKLTNLQELSLSGNQLTHLLPEIGKLTNLRQLWIKYLSQLPPAIGQLTQLTKLHLWGYRLTALPPEIGKLTQLETLDLSNNNLTELPATLTRLTKLKELKLGGNPLTFPPPEIIKQGTQAILAYLRQMGHDQEVFNYEAKLLLVGEGRMGKTSLLHALLGQPFNTHQDSTHGVEIKKLELELRVGDKNQTPTPISNSNSQLKLHAWDFGGQEIYHSTHQFFLTEQAIYAVVWNGGMRLGQGQVEKWLQNIRLKAPDAPILLIATHCDQRPPQLDYARLQAANPQLRGLYLVDSQTGTGLAQLKTALAETAATLPNLKRTWPSRWLQAAQAVTQRPEHHIDRATFAAICREHGVEDVTALPVLMQYLHQLGQIIVYPTLPDLIILKPNWITQAISAVLEAPAVLQANGVLDHHRLPALWANYAAALHPLFLDLMAHYDLAVPMEAQGQRLPQTLIPALLPYAMPAPLPAPPTLADLQAGRVRQVQLLYRFDDKFMPPDLMARFIARTYPHTTQQHWREGVVLRVKTHTTALVKQEGNTLHLQVWGPLPQNFFEHLRYTLEDLLAPFKNLKVERFVPCICPQITQELCHYLHKYQA